MLFQVAVDSLDTVVAHSDAARGSPWEFLEIRRLPAWNAVGQLVQVPLLQIHDGQVRVLQQLRMRPLP
jgi:hypothetical protein